MGALIDGAISLIGGNKTSKAIDKGIDAQTEAAREAIGLQRDIYNQNVAFQSPLYNNGMAASNQMNALLGLGTAPNYAGQVTSGTGGVGGSNMTEDQWAQRALDALRGEVNQSLWSQVQGIQDPSDQLAALEPLMFRRDREVYGEFVGSNPRPVNNGTTQPAPTTGTTNPDGTQQTAQQAAEAAFNVFRNSTGYQSRLNEANNGLNSAYAARGTLQSGAAMQAMARMNQDYASNEFGQYYNMLGGQQQLATGAANALAGVGTNYANAAGQIGMQNGNNIANAAIARANNSNNTLSGITSSFGNTAGALSMFMGSDRRLKKDIVEIGLRPDGLMGYEWTYRHDPEAGRYQGVMADEVKIKRPEAYTDNFDGLGHAGVNYAALGTPMRRVA